MRADHKGFVCFGASRGAQAINTALYNSLALNYLAISSADECGFILNGGFQSSSIVSMFITVTLGIDLLLVPLIVGCLNDSKRRLLFLLVSHCFWIVMVLMGAIFLATLDESDESTLIIYFLSLCAISFAMEIANVLQMAYLPEVAHNENEIAEVSSKNGFLSAVMGIVLAAIITVVAIWNPVSDKYLALYAALGVVFFWVIWTIPGVIFLLKVESGMSAIAPAPDIPVNISTTEPASSVKGKRTTVFATLVLISREYKDIGLFLIGNALFLPAVGNLIVLVTGYLQNAVGYSGSEISLLSVIVLVVSAPSSFLTSFFQRRIGIKRTLLVGLFVWTISSVLPPWTVQSVPLITNSSATNGTLSEPIVCGQSVSVGERISIQPTPMTKIIVPIYAVAWGVGVGMIFSSSTAMFTVLVPGGQETNFFAAKTFCSKVSSWIPSLLYTVINESTGDLNVAVFSLSWFFMLSIPLIYMIDMDRSHKKIRETLRQRRRSSISVQLPKPIYGEN